MKAKVLVAALLALLLGSCPCLMSLASAAAQEAHACCPSPGDQDSGSDCCLRAPSPAAVSFSAPPLVVAGLAASAPPALAVLEAFRLDSAALSPPDAPPFRIPSSRAPPVLS